MSAVDRDGNTALHHAAVNLNFVATRVLIDAGAPLEQKNKDVSHGEKGVMWVGSGTVHWYS